MKDVITAILTNKAARSEGTIETMLSQSLGDASIPWTAPAEMTSKTTEATKA